MKVLKGVHFQGSLEWQSWLITNETVYNQILCFFFFHWGIDPFTVVRLVAWPLNENEAGRDLVLIETSLLFLCKFVLISMRTTSLT